MPRIERLRRKPRIKDSERADVELLRLAALHGAWPLTKKGLRRTANRLERAGRGFVSFTDGGAVFVLRRRAA